MTNLGSKKIDDLFEERTFKIEGSEGEKILRHLHVKYGINEVDRLVWFKEASLRQDEALLILDRVVYKDDRGVEEVYDSL